MQKSMSLTHEPSLELLLITVKPSFSNRELYRSVIGWDYQGDDSTGQIQCLENYQCFDGVMRGNMEQGHVT